MRGLELDPTTDRDRRILEHLPLLHHVVGRMFLDGSGRFDREDLLGVGMLGLIAAADSWDPTRNLKFSTYAFHKIRGAVLDELRRQDFLPRRQRERVRDLDRVVSVLEQRTGNAPSPEEIAEAMALTLEEVDGILSNARLAGAASLDDGPSGELAALLCDPRSEDPVGSAEWNETKECLAKAIDALPEQERSVILLYYGEELLLKEIGEIMQVTESRVSQIHSRALFRLNGVLRKSGSEG